MPGCKPVADHGRAEARGPGCWVQGCGRPVIGVVGQLVRRRLRRGTGQAPCKRLPVQPAAQATPPCPATPARTSPGRATTTCCACRSRASCSRPWPQPAAAARRGRRPAAARRTSRQRAFGRSSARAVPRRCAPPPPPLQRPHAHAGRPTAAVGQPPFPAPRMEPLSGQAGTPSAYTSLHKRRVQASPRVPPSTHHVTPCLKRPAGRGVLAAARGHPRGAAPPREPAGGGGRRDAQGCGAGDRPPARSVRSRAAAPQVPAPSASASGA